MTWLRLGSSSRIVPTYGVPIHAISAVDTPDVASAVSESPNRPAIEISPGASSRIGVRIVARPSEPSENSLSRVNVRASGPSYVASTLLSDGAGQVAGACALLRRKQVVLNVRMPTHEILGLKLRARERQKMGDSRLALVAEPVSMRAGLRFEASIDRLVAAAAAAVTARGIAAKRVHCYSHTRDNQKKESKGTVNKRHFA